MNEENEPKQEKVTASLIPPNNLQNVIQMHNTSVNTNKVNEGFFDGSGAGRMAMAVEAEN